MRFFTLLMVFGLVFNGIPSCLSSLSPFIEISTRSVAMANGGGDYDVDYGDTCSMPEPDEGEPSARMQSEDDPAIEWENGGGVAADAARQADQNQYNAQIGFERLTREYEFMEMLYDEVGFAQADADTSSISAQAEGGAASRIQQELKTLKKSLMADSNAFDTGQTGEKKGSRHSSERGMSFPDKGFSNRDQTISSTFMGEHGKGAAISVSKTETEAWRMKIQTLVEAAEFSADEAASHADAAAEFAGEAKASAAEMSAVVALIEAAAREIELNATMAEAWASAAVAQAVENVAEDDIAYGDDARTAAEQARYLAETAHDKALLAAQMASNAGDSAALAASAADTAAISAAMASQAAQTSRQLAEALNTATELLVAGTMKSYSNSRPALTP